MAHTSGPWEIAGSDSVLSGDEADKIVGAGGEPVLEIGWGGISCESDPYGSYPLLKASDENWDLILAAPVLLDACMEAERGIRGQVEHLPNWERQVLEKYAALLRAAIAKAEGTIQAQKGKG